MIWRRIPIHASLQRGRALIFGVLPFAAVAFVFTSARVQAASLLLPSDGAFYAGNPGSDRWTLSTTINQNTTTPSTTTTSDWACPTITSIGCVDDAVINTEGNPVTLYGLQQSYTTVKWKSLAVPSGQGYYVTFDYTRDAHPNIEYFVAIDNVETPLTNQTATGYVVTVPLNKTLTFGVRNTSNSIDVGTITVSNFSYSPVPAPLPAAGAASAAVPKLPPKDGSPLAPIRHATQPAI